MKKKGFSLVELSIAIVIVGLLIAIGMKMLVPLVERSKRSASRDEVAAAVEAVIGYAETNNRLPTDSQFPEVVRNSKDVWGKDLVYLVDTHFASEDSVCARSSTDIFLKTCATAGCGAPLSTTNNIAFFVMSSGANMNKQTLVDVVGASTTISTYTQGLSGIDEDTSDMDRPEAYDDIIDRVVLSELRVKAGCYGTPLKIITLEIPSGYVLTTYASYIYADEGVPFSDGGDTGTAPDYQWCVTSDAPAGLAYECDGVLATSASCSLVPAAGTWRQCTSLELSGTPTASGAFSLDVYAGDDAGNIASKTFGMSISSISGLNICASYRVWNTAGSAKDFYINAACVDNVADGAEITTASTNEIGNTGTLDQYDDSGTCTTLENGLSYIQAIFADNNADCCVNYNQSDKTCP